MGTLAYDPERLGLLATALGDAGDALGQLRSSDPEAQAAVVTAGLSRAALDSWRVTALGIAGCNVLQGYRPISAANPEIADAAQYVLAQLYGWQLVRDATGDSSVVPAEMQAAGLGYLISSDQVKLDTPDDVAALRAHLDAAVATPEGAAALADNLSPEGAAALLDRLGERRASFVVDAGGPAGVAAATNLDAIAAMDAVDAVVTSIANTIIDVDRPVADAIAVLSAMTPYGAALTISRLDAPDHVIRLLAEHTMGRSLNPGNDPAAWPKPWEEPSPWQYGVGDFLFPRLAAASPADANRFVVDVYALSSDLLFGTVADDRSLTSLLATATDPAGVSAVAAGQVIVPLIGYLEDPPEFPVVASATSGEAVLDTRNALGAIVAPWFAQFSVGGTEWGWTEEEANDAFRFVIANDESWAALQAASERWLDSLRIDPAATDPLALFWELDELGQIIGQLGGLLKLRGAEGVMADRLVWDSFTKYLPKVLNKAAGKAGVTGIPAKVSAKVIGLVVSRSKALAEEHGLPGTPPPLHDALAQLDLDQDQVHAVGAYLAMGSMVEVLIDAGAVPPDTPWPPSPLSADECPTGDYLGVTNEWLKGLRLPDGSTFALISARSAFMSGAQSEATCIELRYG